jgi:hypothetical protein
MSNTSLRIHPAIGFARVGNSEEYYLGPESMAGMPVSGQTVTGGLPIKPGTENTTIMSTDLRDASGKLKRQAARFKIYQYQDSAPIHYPSGAATEVTIGSVVDNKTVLDIIWTVHLANKKANCWILAEDGPYQGISGYQDGRLPPMRNLTFPPSADPSDSNRLQKLVIDAGPRALQASTGATIKFDNVTQSSYWNQTDATTGAITPLPNYPQSFPASGPQTGGATTGSNAITTLGAITTETNGRLLVLGAYGLACGFDNEGNPAPTAALDQDVNNDNWLDDTADGPVTAVLVFSDGSMLPIPGSAWVVSTDPAYAPQTLNVVSLWDDVYTTWVEQMALQPALYQQGAYQTTYKPYFENDVFPILRAASLQMWNTNLPATAIKAHGNIDQLTAPAPKFNIMSFIRDPNATAQAETGAPLMPLSLGDANKSFLTLSTSQYFFMQQWTANQCVGAQAQALGPGETLDKTILFNCLGGRYSPGIDLTFIVRDVNLYNQNWHDPAIGPFRINMQALDYSNATLGTPFLGVGYTPERQIPVQPGDLCKFMAIPWHTDYNSCATHVPSPNPGGDLTQANVYSGTVNTSLFWSWPAQRPVAVYTYPDLVANNGALPAQRYSVRGEGTAAVQQSGDGFDTPAMNVGRYQDRTGILLNWPSIGVIMQGPAIAGYSASYPPNYYLEVESLFVQDDSNLVVPWPNVVTDPTYPPKKG